MTLPRVVFVVNGDPASAMAERANAFTSRLAGRFECKIVYRQSRDCRSLGKLVQDLFAVRPDVSYVLDLATAGVVASAIRKHLVGTPFVLDTGDAIVELGRELGRGPVGVCATQTLEAYALRAASAVVVRSRYHRELMRRRGIQATFVPDGVSVEQFHPPSQRPRVLQTLTIGLVGNTVWVPRRQTCYGWELIELIRLLRERMPIRGVLVGDGSGIEVLKQRVKELGVEDSIEFVGRVPYAELPARLHNLDICLSTQTNDVIGNVRTTGKLPLYLAAGRFILASNVGEAARVLPADMLVPFVGESDHEYPAKLAERVLTLLRRGTDFAHRAESIALAREHFEYDSLALRVGAVLDEIIARGH